MIVIPGIQNRIKFVHVVEGLKTRLIQIFFAQNVIIFETRKGSMRRLSTLIRLGWSLLTQKSIPMHALDDSLIL